jgi:D-tyrosyl-tRNA(Tyr) deacylase
MKALLQRVIKSSVEVDNKIVGEINSGILLFIGIEKNDDEKIAIKMIDKILNYRIFADENDKMNLSIKDTNKEILAISQFTLAADTKSGTRAGFSTAMPPKPAEVLYDYFLDNIKSKHKKIQTGIFGADMQISLINDGPISFILEVK